MPTRSHLGMLTPLLATEMEHTLCQTPNYIRYFLNPSIMSDALEYTGHAFETRAYVDRYAYWVDWRPTPIPTPLTPTPGANDSDEAAPEGPLAYCVHPAENTIPLFAPGFNTLTTAGETYRHLGR
ncbi:MAG: hypothetical protein KJ063_17995 [Anaerolineae bacterium]|nr:hypothetical protein [Anaerolineae bacterium]